MNTYLWLNEEIAFRVGPFLRMLGMLSVLPFSDGIVGVGQRLALASGYALLRRSIAPCEDALLLVIDLLLGVSLALPSALLVDLAGSFGELTDSATGQNLATHYDPFVAAHSSVVATIFRFYLWAALCCGGVLPALLVALERSFISVPNVSFSALPSGSAILALLGGISNATLAAFIPFAAMALALEFVGMCFAKAMPRLAIMIELNALKTIALTSLMLGQIQFMPFYTLPTKAFLWGQELLSRPAPAPDPITVFAHAACSDALPCNGVTSRNYGRK